MALMGLACEQTSTVWFADVAMRCSQADTERS